MRQLRDLEIAPEVVLVVREDGEFKIRVIDGGNVSESNERLGVCATCLQELQVADFSIAGFFQRYGRHALDPGVVPDQSCGAL